METTLTTPEARRSALTHSFLDVTDGVRLATYEWAPPQSPKAVVQIAHGLAEHAGRYDRLAQALTRAGFAVFASDHRGHGRTARDPGELGFFASDHGFATPPCVVCVRRDRCIDCAIADCSLGDSGCAWPLPAAGTSVLRLMASS